MNLIAQLFGLGAMASLFLVYQQKSRKRMLFAKLSADICWVIHYLLLGGIAGMIPNAVGIFRELVFINRNNKKWASCIVWPILFILINWTLGLRTFHAWYNILPIAASTFVTVSVWIDNPRLTKLMSIPICTAFLIYDMVIGSYIGIINESISLFSILIYFVKEKPMATNVFTNHIATDKELILDPCVPIAPAGAVITAAATISAVVSDEARQKGEAFAAEITRRFVSDFEQTAEQVLLGKVAAKDRMAHVSTFIVVDDTVYMTYYANTKEHAEDPKNQTARLVYAPMDDIDDKTFIDLQTTGNAVGDKVIDMVYDTILMKKDERTLYILWTARTTDANYYRFYCPFDTVTKTLGEIGVNRFKVGDTVNDFSTSGFKAALAANGLHCKKTYSDIGIMQKQSYRMENGEMYCYSGAYSGDWTCIIKSRDLITWEFVAQPDFPNESKWENATYVLGDKVFYFVRQQDTCPYGFLTAYDLVNGTWDTPVLVADCQSRSDFIVYKDELYLFHAPIDREHIGILKIDTQNLANTKVILQAKMDTGCFYPFVQYYRNNELAMSYTLDRKHIRLAEFTLSKYL